VLKKEFAERFETGVTEAKLATLTHVSRAFDELLNRSPNSQAPYVGRSAFATKAGIHASAIVKEPETYEHVPPDSIGNRRRMLVSDQAGKSNLLAELARIGLAVDKNDSRLDALLREVKEREAQGYAYDGADASFEILARRMLGTVPHYFDVQSFRVIVEQRHNALGELVTMSEAVVKVKVDDEVFINAGEGNGPVNALDVALRKDLGKFQRFIDDLELADYKVRILNGGTGATTRVLVESRDGKGQPLVHRRRVAQYRRCVLPGLVGFDRLQAAAGRGGGRGGLTDRKSHSIAANSSSLRKIRSLFFPDGR
jgi:2-isopropylmalate synthase